MKTALLASLSLLICVPTLQAQLSHVVVADFERAVVQSVEGKKASDKFNAALQAKQTDIEKRQKDIEEQQKKLQTGARTLNDAAKAEIQKDIDKRTTELQRLNEDAQKDLQGLRDQLLRPIAERATAILQRMASEQNYTVVVDVSNQQNNVVWYNPKNDITADLIKRIDAETPKEPAASAPPKPPAAPPSTTTRPATPPASAPAAPKKP